MGFPPMHPVFAMGILALQSPVVDKATASGQLQEQWLLFRSGQEAVTEGLTTILSDMTVFYPKGVCLSIGCEGIQLEIPKPEPENHVLPG
jgi:hypothetical protein